MFAISGTIKPLTPEAVAKAIVRGIDRKRFLICPDTGTTLLARAGGLLSPALNWTFDRRVRQASRPG
jgi:3-dehydrosphinganine reductase